MMRAPKLATRHQTSFETIKDDDLTSETDEMLFVCNDDDEPPSLDVVDSDLDSLHGLNTDSDRSDTKDPTPGSHDPTNDRKALEGMQKDLLHGIDSSHSTSTAHMYIPIESRFQQIHWLESFGPKRGGPLLGYLNVSGPRVQVKLVNDVECRTSRRAVPIGHIKGYPCAGAGVYYGVDDGVLYLFLDEETEEKYVKFPRVYRWASLHDVVQKPQEIWK
jgi:hypothetical protein